MVRQRNVKSAANGPSDSASGRRPPKVSFPKDSSTSSSSSSSVAQFLWIGVGLALIAVVAFLVHLGYYDSLINTPLRNAPKVITSDDDDKTRFWGSYRPGTYFGLKTRSPHDLVTGLMWMVPELVRQNDVGLRHWCEQGDNLDSFGWIQHDGENFGFQEIVDRSIKLNTSFVKRSSLGNHGGDWTARISVKPKLKKFNKHSISLFFYVGLEDGSSDDGEFMAPVVESVKVLKKVIGKTKHLGMFDISFNNLTPGAVVDHFYASVATSGPQEYTSTVMQQFRLFGMKTIGLDHTHMQSQKPNFIVYQVMAQLPFEMEVIFKSKSGTDDHTIEELSGDVYEKELNAWKSKFSEKFEETFHLKEKGYSEKEIHFAQAAVSNMIGGIGYFYGHSLVQSGGTKSPVKYWDAPLYTAVPSRSFFPRGFLWDEGFHNLLISKWNPQISADILGHWMDLINDEGWIPREQILGLEARAKVPAEFIVQRNQNANPPTLLLTLKSIVSDMKGILSPEFRSYLERMWPRLVSWYNWFNNSQAGEIPGTYRWRGRNASAIYELNPKTLTSGLDDFPRASHPTVDERHVDLRCWMALASALMVDIGKLIGKRQSEIEQYSETARLLSDNGLLDAMHWSEEHRAYLDYGLHTEGVVLKRPPPPPPSHRHQSQRLQQLQRVVTKEPTLQFVNQVGYVALFPFFLQLIKPDSEKLKKILEDLEDPDVFYTPYGLRSLSKGASLYMKKNTEHDAPYWRGPIWINVNYLTVRALYHYSRIEGPYRDESKRIYEKLRKGIIDNVVKEYYRTGYVWEQYLDKNGFGHGCRPFTGWSALVVLMMGENY